MVIHVRILCGLFQWHENLNLNPMNKFKLEPFHCGKYLIFSVGPTLEDVEGSMAVTVQGPGTLKCITYSAVNNFHDD